MIKNFLYIAALLPIFAACSSETVETPVDPTSAIGFDAPFINKATRSTGNDLTTDNITGFKVWGNISNAAGVKSALFTAQQVNQGGADAPWSYTPLKYWVDGANYEFLALAQFNGTDCTVSIAPDDATNLPGTVTATITGDEDLAYDYQTRNSVNGTVDKSRVPFTFQHMLSKIKFTAENGTDADDNLTFKVTDVKITNACPAGTCTLKSDYQAPEAERDVKCSWAPDNTAAAIEMNFGACNEGNAISANEKFDTQNHKFILPLAGTQYEKLTVQATVEVIEAGVSIKTVTVETSIPGTSDPDHAFSFTPGWSYNFICQLTRGNMDLDNPILFDVVKVDEFYDYTETQWTTTDQVTIK